MTKLLIAIVVAVPVFVADNGHTSIIKPAPVIVPLRPHTMALLRDGKPVPLRLLDGAPGQDICWYGTPEGGTLFGRCPAATGPVEPRNHFPVMLL